MNHLEQYRNAVISNIRYGHGAFRSKILYAQILDANGDLLVSADMDYCVQRMTEAAKYFAKVDAPKPKPSYPLYFFKLRNLLRSPFNP